MDHIVERVQMVPELRCVEVPVTHTVERVIPVPEVTEREVPVARVIERLQMVPEVPALPSVAPPPALCEPGWCLGTSAVFCCWHSGPPAGTA